jgi:NADP-dependent 3-hydroxy acid dehydrogenase YdfG
MLHPLPMTDAVQALSARHPRKRILVTGAASGLGLELCRRFARAGWTIGMLDMNADALASATLEVERLGGVVRSAVVDVADAAAFTAAIETFVAGVQGLDVMVNNAGVAVGGDFLETPLDDWRWIVGINLLGVVCGARATLPALLENRGTLVNVASAAGFASSAGMSAYNTTKAAVVALSETLYAETLGTGVQVSVAMPYFFKTGLMTTLRASQQGRRDAQRMFDSTPYTLEQAATDVLNGVVAGRLYVLAPRWLALLWFVKRMHSPFFLRTFRRLRDRQLARNARAA